MLTLGRRITVAKAFFARSSRYRGILTWNVSTMYIRHSISTKWQLPFGTTFGRKKAVLRWKVSTKWRESDVKSGRGKFRETPTPLRRHNRCTFSLLSQKKENKNNTSALTDVTVAIRLCTTRKHEWRFTPQTFPPYRSTRMCKISLLGNLDWNRDKRG